MSKYTYCNIQYINGSKSLKQRTLV